MRDVADTEFFDNELEAQVKAAFDGVEPSKEAKERMLANLLAHEAQVQGSAGVAGVAEPAGVAESSEESAASEVPAAEEAPAADEAFFFEEPEITVVTMPQAKRRIRPWQVLVPVAAVLAMVGIVVASGPLMNTFSLSSAESAAESSAESAMESTTESAATEAASTGAKDAGASAVEEATEADAAATEAASTSDEKNSVVPSAASAAYESAEDEGIESQLDSLNAAGNADVEQSWARDFYTIELEDGTVLEIDSHDAPVPVSETVVGELLEEALAINEEATASITCSVYTSKADEEAYLVSFLGESIYFPAHKK